MAAILILALSVSLISAVHDRLSWSIASPLRSSNELIIALLIAGIRDSPTLNRLVQAIERHRWHRLHRRGACRRGSANLRACLVNDVVAAGGRRYLRVLVGTTRERADLTGSIGHELQHVLEVLSDRSVTNTASMLAFYQNDGRSGVRSYETEAAVDAGLAVAREISASEKIRARQH